eukprot:g8815.t1
MSLRQLYFQKTAAVKIPSRTSNRVWCCSLDKIPQNLSSDSITRREFCFQGLSPIGLCLCSTTVFKQRSNLYDKYFSYVLSHFQTDYNEWITPYKAQLFDTITTEAPIRILELGVGTGQNFQFIAKQTPNAKVVGLDPNPEMQQYAEQGAKIASIDDFQFVVGYGEALPFEANSFDVVIGTLILCSVPDVDKVLSEIRRVMTPQGRYLFFEHVIAPEQSSTRFLQVLFNPLQQVIADGCHLTRDTSASIKSSGFRAVDVQSVYIDKASFLAPHIFGTAFI